MKLESMNIEELIQKRETLVKEKTDIKKKRREITPEVKDLLMYLSDLSKNAPNFVKGRELLVPTGIKVSKDVFGKEYEIFCKFHYLCAFTLQVGVDRKIKHICGLSIPGKPCPLTLYNSNFATIENFTSKYDKISAGTEMDRIEHVLELLTKNSQTVKTNVEQYIKGALVEAIAEVEKELEELR